MLDFAELRNRILMGEDEVPEEVKESPLTQEFLRPATGFPILFGGLSVAFVIADKLANYKNLNITRLAQGIPMGGEVHYLDENTLNTAFQSRKKIT